MLQTLAGGAFVAEDWPHNAGWLSMDDVLAGGGNDACEGRLALLDALLSLVEVVEGGALVSFLTTGFVFVCDLLRRWSVDALTVTSYWSLSARLVAMVREAWPTSIRAG